MGKIINFNELKNEVSMKENSIPLKKQCVTRKYFEGDKIRRVNYTEYNEETKIKTTYKNKYHYDKYNRVRLIKAFCNDAKSYKHTIKFKYENDENYIMKFRHRLYNFSFTVQITKNKITKIESNEFDYIIDYDEDNRMTECRYVAKGIHDFDYFVSHTQFSILKSLCKTSGNIKINYYKDDIIESIYKEGELIYKNIFENDKLIKQIYDKEEYNVIYNSNTIQIINEKTQKQTIYDSETHNAIYTNNKFYNNTEYEIKKENKTIIDLTNNIYTNKSIDTNQLAIVSMDKLEMMYGYHAFNEKIKIEEVYDDSLPNEIYKGMCDEAEMLLSLNLDDELRHYDFNDILAKILKIYLF